MTVLKSISVSIVMMMTALLMAACQTVSVDTAATERGVKDEPVITTEQAPRAKSPLASYLVGRYAIKENDVPLAAEEFAATLAGHPLNTRLMQLSFSTFYINGDVDNAAVLAGQLEARGENVTFGSEPSLILAIEARDYAGMAVLADHIAADEVTRPLGIIAGSWALILQDQGDAGLTRISELTSVDDRGKAITPFVVYSQSALMNEYLGRPDDAIASAVMAIDHPDTNIAVIMNMAGVLARLGYGDQARDILDENLNQIFHKTDILAKLADGTSPLLMRPDMDSLLAEAIYEASFVSREGRISSAARLFMASRLAETNSRINYAIGLYYQDLDQFDNTMRYFDRIPENSLWNQPRLFLTAQYLSYDGEDQTKAKQLFDDLVAANPSSSSIWQQSAHAARRRGDHQFALDAYDKAIALSPNIARLHYSKAIVLDQLEQKEETEAALRHSLKLNPDNAYALNYLGYWLLEEGGDVEEALGFIRKAIEKQPQNGYFMDSLGWGYYRLGQYRQAVLYLERAVTLEPQDPIITDHLGDAYALMRREREARYQWERALKFDPDDDLKGQIIDKLKNGLNP